MRKNIISFALIAAAFLAASCQKEINPENGTPIQDAPQFTASIESCGNTKTTVEREDGTPAIYKTKWESTDFIKINDATYQATPDGTDKTKATFTMTEGTAPSADYYAYFPASIYDGSTATLPTTYTYDNYTASKYNMPMYAESSTTSLSFKNLCGILAITVPSTQMTKVTSISVTSDQRMNGAFTSTKEGVLTFTSSAELTDADKKVTLSFSTAKTIENSVTFYIPVPAGTHNPLTINVSDGTLMKTMVTKKSGGVEISRNVVYPISFADNQPFILSGLFSVSATKQVRFSKGNLYWDGDDSAFKIENNQTAYPTSWSTSHVGHFFWTNLTDYNSGNASYMPYASSYAYSSQTVSDKFWCGEDNKLTVDGQSNLYALSQGEWYYLINSRTSGTCKTGVTFVIEETDYENWLVIAPDGYTGSIASSYDAAAWATAEASGLVCLPATGYRDGKNLNESDSFYWSSTPLWGEVDSAYDLHFGYDEVDPSDASYRINGYSVRLVSTVTE